MKKMEKKLQNIYLIRERTTSQSFSEDSFKLFRFTVGLVHLEKLSFAQASTHIASANAKKLKWQIFGPSDHRAKNQNFRNPTNYIPLDPELYAYHYSQKDYTLKSNCKKDNCRNVSLYLKTLCGTKLIIFKIFSSYVVKTFTSFIFWWTSSLKSGASVVLFEQLENVFKYLLTFHFLTENNPAWQSS